MALLGVAGCTGSGRVADLDQQQRAYRAGGLGFALDAVASVRDDTTGVDVYLSVPSGSLVFRARSGDYEAIARWTVTVEQEGRAPRSADPIDTLRVASPEAGRTRGPVRRTLRFDVPPGRYAVRAVLEDAIGERTAEQRAQVEVVAPTGQPTLGGLRLEGRLGEGPVTPLVASSLPAGVDSLQAVAQALAAPDSSVVVATVVRFRTDTTASTALSAFTPSDVSLAATGIDMGRVDTVQVVRQPLAAPAEAVRIEAPVPPLGPGVYRLRLALVAPGTPEPVTEADRLVVVRRRDYPLVTRLGDLVPPLVYLAEADEMARLREAVGTPRLQAVFDRFWGERLDDRRVAAATVRAFYERVEEANRLFATQKEGWKTDPGQVYVLFGPPAYVEATPRGEVWHYGIRGAAPPSLTFRRTAGGPGDRRPFQVLTLVRDRSFHETWRRARRMWRTGQVP
ncbi:MAG: GWxTD domain-containing protein [Bacteroidota bacterium]